MTNGEVHEVSHALGELRGEVSAIKTAVKEGNQSRRDLHEKVNTLGQQMTEISAKLQGVVGAFEALAGTVRTHEQDRQQVIGGKRTLAAIAAIAGTVAAAGVEAAKAYFGK